MFRLLSLVMLAIAVVARPSQAQERPPWIAVQPDEAMMGTSDVSDVPRGSWQVEPFAQPVLRRWSASVDALLLSRSGEKNGVLASDGSGVRLVADDLDLQLAAGTEFALRGGERLPLEVVYSVLDDWSSGASEVGNLMVHGPGFQQGFGNGTYRFDYASQFQSAGIRWYFWDQKVFVGPRWLELNEEIDGRLGSLPIYSLRAENTLLGGQVGTTLSLSPDDWRWRFEVLAGVGAYHHRARVTSTSTNLAHGDLATAPDPQTNDVTFIGEASLRWSWRLNSSWSIRSTYCAMWVDGLALAPAQLPQISSVPFVTSGQPADNDRLLLLGFSVGVEADW